MFPIIKFAIHRKYETEAANRVPTPILRLNNGEETPELCAF